MPLPARPAARRTYDATRRRRAAQRTRQAIVEAATRRFLERGYTATTVADIAADAGVALDTVYAVVGRKPTLFRLLIESAVSGPDPAVSAEARASVAIRAEPDARRKLEGYARAIRDVHARLAPLLRALQAAAAAEPELAAVWSDIADRRARTTLVFASELAATGWLRPGVSVGEAADVIWATNSPELYLLLVLERGWPPDRYAAWLADAWQRLLLREQD